MMKNIIYSIAVVVTVALVSCSKSDTPVSGYPADGVVRISPTVAAPLTRAEGSTEFNGSDLGLGLFYGENDKYNRDNSLWTKDGSGNWNADTPVLWKNAETEVEVYAFAPYSQEGFNSVSRSVYWSIPSDQSAGLDGADFLWYSGKVTPKNLTDGKLDGKLDVELKHALLKLTVNLSFGNEFGDTDPEIKEVWLNGTMASVYCHLDHGNRGLLYYTASKSLDIKMHKAADKCYEAIFYPSTGQMRDGDMLTVILANGRDYHLKLSADFPFEKDSRNDNYYLGGCAYSMSAQVGKNKIVLEDISIVGWAEGNSNDPLEVEEKN